MNVLTCILVFVVLAYTNAFADIAGYTPETDVVPHAVLDEDQKSIEEALSLDLLEEGFDIAKDIYENGGHSQSYAEIAFNYTKNPTTTFFKGTPVTGTSVDGRPITAKIHEDTTVNETIKIQYDTPAQCRFGGLVAKDQVKTGCLKESGNFTVGRIRYSYEGYNVTENTKNGCTLQGFSLSTKSKMYTQSDACPGCPYQTFKEYYNFYGDFQYGDKIIQEAFAKGSTSFDHMNVNFSNMEYLGRVEAVKKGTIYLNLFMYVIREMEDSIDHCEKELPYTEGAWDKAVAFYTGSLEGPGTQGKTDGKFLFRLAENECQQFKTCGKNGDSTDGTAKVNLEIFRHFNRGKRLLSEGKCSNVRNTVDKIIRLMAIPMIQGALRNAHKLGVTDSATISGELTTRSDESVMEGHIFTMAVLPMINRCDAEDAKILEDNMGAKEAFETDFHQVQRAFERNYPCLGIRCADVGGIYSKSVKTYLTGGDPCNDKSTSSGSSTSASTISIVLGIAAAVVAVISIFGIFYMRAREKQGKPVFKESTQKEIT